MINQWLDDSPKYLYDLSKDTIKVFKGIANQLTFEQILSLHYLLNKK